MIIRNYLDVIVNTNFLLKASDKTTLFIFKKKITHEFLRYVLVGGLAFILDFVILILTKEFIFTKQWYSLYISTGLGFASGLTVNYILSIHFVFLNVKGTKVGRSLRDIIVFVLVGIIGLFLTELGMYLGTEGFKINYLFVKIIVTTTVLLWNYTARKVLIF